MGLIETVIGRIIQREGGYVDHPTDQGGPTNFGVTLATLADYWGHPVSAEAVKALTEAEARKIYLELYVVRPGFAKVADLQLLDLLVDVAVNHGPSRAVTWIQRAAGLLEDGVMGPKTKLALDVVSPRTLCKRIVAERARFYGRIITHRPGQAVFAAGWMNRLAEFVEAL